MPPSGSTPRGTRIERFTRRSEPQAPEPADRCGDRRDRGGGLALRRHRPGDRDGGPGAHPVTPPSTDIFASVHGWIAVGTSKGIEAIDPDDPERSMLPLEGSRVNPIGMARGTGVQLLCTTEPEPGGPLRSSSADGTRRPTARCTAAAIAGCVHAGWDRGGRSPTNGASSSGRHRDGSDACRSPAATAGAGTGFAGYSSGQLSPDGSRPSPYGRGDPAAQPRDLVDEPPTAHTAASISSTKRRSQAPARLRRSAFQERFLEAVVVPGRYAELTFEADGQRTFHSSPRCNADGTGAASDHRTERSELRPARPGRPTVGRIACNELTRTPFSIMDADGSHMRTVMSICARTPFLFAAWNPVPAPSSS